MHIPSKLDMRKINIIYYILYKENFKTTLNIFNPNPHLSKQHENQYDHLQMLI